MITPIIWNRLITNADWIGALATILDDVEDSDQSDSNERAKLQDQLQTFVEKSPSRLSALDDIAARVSVDVMITDVARRIGEIRARNAELSALATALGEQVEAANRDAGRILRITAEINKAKDAILAVKNMASRLSEDKPDAVDAIRAVLDGLSSLDSIYRLNT
jgi:hypothetical protein